jgi:hypothetical protein
MHDTTRKLFAVSAVVALLVSTMGAGAAAIVWDSETTTTATESDVAGNTGQSLAITYGNASNYTYFETDGASTGNLTLKITPGPDDVDYVVYKNTTAETVNASNGHYAFNVSGDELEDAARDVDGATYDVAIINQSSGKTVLESDDVEVTASADNDKAVMALAESPNNAGALTPLVADSVDLEDKSAGWFGSLASYNPLSNSSSSDVQISRWSGYTTVDGTNTTVEVLLSNASTSSSYSDVAEGYDDGDWMMETTVYLNGVPHKVYKNQAPDSVADDETTVVYKSSSDKLVMDPAGDHYDGVRQLQIRGTSQEGYGFGTLWSSFGWMTALESLAFW